jgi:hypothetical protein
MTQKLNVPHLPDVVATMLWPLYNRAAEARRPDARLHDPHALRIADALVLELPYPGGRGFFYGFLVYLLLRLPKLRNQTPSFVHLRFAPPETAQGSK